MNPTQSLLSNSTPINVANVGDVNVDGVDDLLLSIPNASETPLFLILGGATLSPIPDLSFTYPARSAQTGSSLAGLGDINGASMDDFAVREAFDNTINIHFGTPNLEALGQADVVLTRPIEEGKYFFILGIGLTAGDFDGDGFNDLVTQPAIHRTTDRTAGVEAIFVYLGGPAFDAVADVRLPLPKRYLGLDEPGYLDFSVCELSFLDDLNGDGKQELFVGSFDDAYRGIGPTPNAIVLPGGGSPDSEPLFALTGPNQLTGLGSDINNIYSSQHRSAIGDFDGDGLLRLVASTIP